MRSRLRVMILKVPIGGDHRLPNTVQVRMTICHPRRPICLRRRWYGGPLLPRNESRKGDGCCDKSNRDSGTFAHSSHGAITRFERGQEILNGMATKKEGQRGQPPRPRSFRGRGGCPLWMFMLGSPAAVVLFRFG